VLCLCEGLWSIIFNHRFKNGQDSAVKALQNGKVTIVHWYSYHMTTRPICGGSTKSLHLHLHCGILYDEPSKSYDTHERTISKKPPMRIMVANFDKAGDSLPDLHTRLKPNVQSALFSQQSASTSRNSPLKASTSCYSPLKASTSRYSPLKALTSHESPSKAHTLSSDDEENPVCQRNQTFDDVPMQEDEISIIEDYTQTNTSRGPLNVILDDAPDIEYCGSPTVSSKSSSQISSGVGSSGWSTFDTQSIGSSNSFRNREMEKENFGVKRSINCLDDDDDYLSGLNAASVNFESNPVLFNPKESEITKNMLLLAKKTTNKKLRTEEIREEKAEKKRQREALKQHREAEKARLKAQKEVEKAASRAFKPGECMKYMIINIDRRLLESVSGSQIISQLQTAELRYRVVDQPVQRWIILRRTSSSIYFEQTKQARDMILSMVSSYEHILETPFFGLGRDPGGFTSCYKDCLHIQIRRISLTQDYINDNLDGQGPQNNKKINGLG
ncbi:unnamed protein product, partial [Meganyctiphanes norvegica]